MIDSNYSFDVFLTLKEKIKVNTVKNIINTYLPQHSSIDEYLHPVNKILKYLNLIRQIIEEKNVCMHHTHKNTQVEKKSTLDSLLL